MLSVLLYIASITRSQFNQHELTFMPLCFLCENIFLAFEKSTCICNFERNLLNNKPEVFSNTDML